MNLLLTAALLIAATLVASIHFNFNPAIPVFIILGFGLYMVGRVGGARLPAGTHVSFGDTYGVNLEGRDFVAPDTTSHSGPNFRDGAGPDNPQKTG